MIRYFFHIGFIFFIVTIGFCESAPWVYELARVDNQIEKSFSKKYKLSMTGVGGGGVQGFHRYSPQFQHNEPTTKDQARVLILSLAEETLQIVNSNQVLKTGMISFPFTPANLGLSIFYKKPSGDFVNNGEIFVVSIYEDKIGYGLREDKIGPMNRDYEPLREALDKIEGSRQKFPFIWECVEKLEAK